MKKWRHIMFILFALLLLVMIVYVFYPQFYINIVSDNVRNLEKATVIVKKTINGQSPCVIEITEKVQLKELYCIIKNTKSIKINRYPRHSVVISANPQYEIQLFYSNGKIDRLGTPENPQLVYRILENDDNGYIIGQNNDLLEYVLCLAGEARQRGQRTRGQDKGTVLLS